MTDTTDPKRAEDALRESEARHRLLVETWTQANWETDAAGVVVTDSPSWRAYTGQTFEECLGYGWLEAVHPDDRAYAEWQWREAVAAGRFVDAEFRLRSPDGGWRWTNVRAAPVLDDAGEIEKWVGTNIDIDARRRAEDALREREADLARVQRIGRVGGLDIDVANGLTSRRSPEYLRLHGLGPESEFETHADWRARVHPDDVEEAERALFAALAGTGSIYDSEYRIIRASDGAVRWIHARVDIERDATGKAVRLVGAHLDVTEQKRLQEELCESEARQAFLLRLSDALRPLSDSAELERAAVTLLGQELRASRVFYATLDSGEQSWSVTHDYSDGLPSNAGRYPLTGFQQYRLEQWRSGAMSSVDDCETHPGLNPQERAAYAAFQARAAIGVPLVSGGRLAALLVVNQITPRAWTSVELALTRETAERTWAAIQRARIERALDASERRLRTLVAGVPQLVWRAVDGGHWTWASPQWTEYTGQSAADSLGQGWLEPVHPDDRETARALWAGATERGEFSADYRICHAAEHRYRWFQTRATPVRGEEGTVVEWLGTSTDVDDLRQLQDRQALLVAELQHRVRNILTVVRSVFGRTIEAGGELEDIANHFRGRLDALARTQVVVTQTAAGDVDLEDLIREELLSVGVSDGEEVTISGPEVRLSPKIAETIGLAIHELTTNAIKYGALQAKRGELRIEWSANLVEGGTRHLRIRWTEQGVPAIPLKPSRYGFGLELIEEALPYRLGAETKLEFRGGGIRCTISMPLPP